MNTAMARKKPKPKPGRRYPSRERVKYVAVPVEYWDALDALGRPDDRSVSYMVRRAVREFLERHGQLPSPEPPKG